MAINFIEKKTNQAVALISAAQDFTTGWVDLGKEIDVRSTDSMALWLNVDINDGANTRVRILAKHTNAGSDEYNLPIKTVSASSVAIEDELFEFNVDADQKIILAVDLDNLVNFVQVQIQAGTVGATAAQVDSAYITWKG